MQYHSPSPLSPSFPTSLFTPWSPKALKEKIQQLKSGVEEQLKRYSGDERFNKTIGKTKLIKLVLIFSGSELKYMGETD
jgi:hypothetical protein